MTNYLPGCSDGFCYIKGKATGMHTNGWCRCVQNLMRSDLGDTVKRVAIERVLINLHKRNADLEHTRDMLLERIRLLTYEPPGTTFTSTGKEG